jgi:hypothetical protein
MDDRIVFGEVRSDRLICHRTSAEGQHHRQ